jgi:hypothetical protein
MRRTMGAMCMAASILLAALFVWYSMWQASALCAMSDQLSRDGVVNWERFSAANPELPAHPGGLARFIDQGYGLRVFTTGCLLAVTALVSATAAMAGGRRQLAGKAAGAAGPKG